MCHPAAGGQAGAGKSRPLYQSSEQMRRVTLDWSLEKRPTYKRFQLPSKEIFASGLLLPLRRRF